MYFRPRCTRSAIARFRNCPTEEKSIDHTTLLVFRAAYVVVDSHLQLPRNDRAAILCRRNIQKYYVGI